MANRASAHCAVSLYKFPYLHFENGHARVTHGARSGAQSRPYGSHPVENTVWGIFETLWGPSKVLKRVFTSRDRNVYWLLLKSKAVFFWFVGKVWVCHFDMKQGLQRTRHFEASLNLTVQKHFSANWNETRTCIPHMTVFLRAHCVWRKRTLNFWW